LNRIIIFLLLEHYPFGKPVATFPDHALTLPGGGCLAQANSAIDPARAFTDDEGVVLDCFVALPGNDEKYGSIPLMAFPVGLPKLRLAARHECPLPDLQLHGGSQADPGLPCRRGPLWNFLRQGNKFPSSELILSGRVPHICNPWVQPIFLLDLTFCRRFYGANSVARVRIRPTHCL
jgi:hypothetical protein